jgi:hypothetical protein
MLQTFFSTFIHSTGWYEKVINKVSKVNYIFFCAAAGWNEIKMSHERFDTFLIRIIFFKSSITSIKVTRAMKVRRQHSDTNVILFHMSTADWKASRFFFMLSTWMYQWQWWWWQFANKNKCNFHILFYFQ